VRWLITGASGFLGANAVRVLSRSAGNEIVGLVRSPDSAPWCSRTAVGDLLDPKDIARVVEQEQPDAVLHCAALANHHACEQDEALAMRINAEASGNLAAASTGARFIYISTDAVFSGERGWYEEDDPVSPNNAYGRSKAAGEQAVLAAHPSAVIARTNFFGWSPSGQRSILEFFLHELDAGNRVPGFVDYTVTSLFVDDVVESIERVVASGESGIFHVVARDAVSKFDFGRLVAAQLGLDAALIDEAPAPSGPKDLSLRSDRLTALRGSPMPSQGEGLARARTSPRFPAANQPLG